MPSPHTHAMTLNLMHTHLPIRAMRRLITGKLPSRRIRSSISSILVSHQHYYSQEARQRSSNQSYGNYKPHTATPSLDPVRIKAAFNILEIHESATITEVRHAYYQLAKKYHPDSVSNTMADTTQDMQASTAKFAAVYQAYELLKNVYAERDTSGSDTIRDWMKFAEDVAAAEGIDVSANARAKWSSNPDIFNRKLPQSRHYLSNEGVGYGPSPFERNKQFKNFKVERAVDSVSDYKRYQLEHEMEESRKHQAAAAAQRKDKDGGTSGQGISVSDVIAMIKNIEQQTEDRMIQKKSRVQRLEETIKNAMQEWEGTEEFRNKPLNTHIYDTGDPLTNKLNAILARNGVQPEWLRIERSILRHYEAAHEQLSYHWHNIQHLDPQQAQRERQIEIEERSKEQDELDKAWDSSLSGNKMTNNPKLAKQLMKDLLNDRHHAYQSTTSSSQYVYNAHTHSNEDEYRNCHQCYAWNKAIQLAKSDLHRTNQLVTEFNLAVPSVTRQKMQFLLQNLVAEVTSEKPKVHTEVEQQQNEQISAETASSTAPTTPLSKLSSRNRQKAKQQMQPQLQRKRPTYNSAFRVYPRDADEIRRNELEYCNRQDFRVFEKAMYNRPVVNASIAVTVVVSVMMAIMGAGMVNLAKRATSKEVDKTIMKIQASTP